MVFLGIILNGRKLQLEIPQQKKDKVLNLLNWTIGKKKVTVLTIQRLTGILNFLSKAIVPGRTFIRRMYDAICPKLSNTKGNKLKQYHHVNLGQGFIQDCEVWKMFLEQEHVSTSHRICQPFIDIDLQTNSEVIQFYSDASASRTHGGMDAVLENHWIAYHWGAHFIEKYHPSIEFLELFALVAGILTWAEKLKNMKIQNFCDNQSVRDMINGMGATSKCPHCMKLIRILILDNLKWNRRISVIYVKSQDNFLADPLSIGNFGEFWRKAPKTMMKTMDHLPGCLFPPEKFY